MSGSRGPLTKPAAMKKLSGTYRGSSDRQQAKVPLEGSQASQIAPCPDWLSQEGKDYWALIVPELEARGVIIDIDWSALVVLCVSYGNAMQLAKESANCQQFYTAASGLKKVNPILKVRADAFRQFFTNAAYFGLTPTSRNRVTAFDLIPDVVPDQDSYSEFRISGAD